MSVDPYNISKILTETGDKEEETTLINGFNFKVFHVQVTRLIAYVFI